MYESPINMIIQKLYTNLESDCMKYVQRYGFDVDKEELAKALKYDREQYEKGYADGYNKAIDDFVNKIKDELNRFEVKNLDTCVLFDFIDRKAERLKIDGEND